MNDYITLFQDNRDTLSLYTKALTRAHGQKHPEVYKVFDIYHAILEANEHNLTHLSNLWQEMDQITHHYQVPQDGCPTYRKSYALLADLSHAFKQAKEESS